MLEMDFTCGNITAQSIPLRAFKKSKKGKCMFQDMKK